MAEKTLSQQYIGGLKKAVKHAKRHKDNVQEEYNMAHSYHANTVEWHGKMKVYYEKLDATNEAYKIVDVALNNLLKQAETVNTNVEHIAEAVKLLAYNVLYVSQRFDDLFDHYKAIKNDIDNKRLSDKGFKPNAFMQKFETLGGADGKMAKGAAACRDTLLKALELLKAFYALHYGMDSHNKTGQKIEHITKILRDDWVVTDEYVLHRVVYEDVECVINGVKKDLPGGLEWLIGQLQKVLTSGNPYPPKIDGDADCYPCSRREVQLPDEYFPLTGGHRLHGKFKAQAAQAKSESEAAQAKLTASAQKLQKANSSYDGYKAALDAAEAAKNTKK